MKITLCLIVRDEEKNLAQCLDSFQALYDEIVLVDTGSIDRTKEIAREFNARIFDFEWCDDFSAARNYALSKVGTDWVMMVDADDVIDSDIAPKLLADLKHLPSSTQGVILPYLLPPYDHGLQVYKPRIWKNSLGARYKLAVHEYLNPTNDQLKRFVRLEYPLKHSTPTELFKKSMKRNLAILQKAVQLEPDEARYYFYLGHDNEQAGKVVEAIEWYRQFTELPNIHPDELNRALVRKGRCNLRIGNLQDAEQDFLNAIKAQPAFIDPYLQLAEIKRSLGSHEETVQYYVKAAHCRLPQTHVFVHASLYNGYAIKKLEEFLESLKPHAS